MMDQAIFGIKQVDSTKNVCLTNITFDINRLTFGRKAQS